MSTNSYSSLDILKKEAISSILSSIDIKFPYIKNDLIAYTKSSQENFDSLLNKYIYKEENISSSQMSAMYLLSYLDLYALYIILYANSYVFENLKLASLNKYSYVSYLYKDIHLLIKEKYLAKENNSVLYSNFSKPDKIDISASQSLYLSKNLNGTLSYNNILSLPIYSSNEISPKSIIISDNDKSVHETENNSYLNNIDYTILRKQFNKISICSVISPLSINTKYNLVPEIYGTIRGYISEHIYLAIEDLEYIDEEENIISSIELKISTNGLQWSDTYSIYPDEESSVLIEDNIDTGLKIILRNGYGLSKGDSWKINIRNIQIENPIISSRINISSMEQVSYIKYIDLSKYTLEDKSFLYKETKYDNYNECNVVYKNGINTIIPIQSKIDELKINSEQKEPYNANKDGLFTYNYNFKIQDIVAVLNQYYQSGLIALYSIAIDKVNAVTMSMNYLLDKENEYNDSEFINQRMFIENSIILNNSTDKIEIPIIDKDAGSKIIELINPVSVDTANKARINLRFPLDNTETIKIYDINNNDIITVDNSNIFNISNDMYYVILDNYENNNSYIIEYSIKQYTFDEISNTLVDSKWNSINNIAYIYYKDIDNKNNLYIGEIINGNITDISAECTPIITMKSIEAQYKSPFIYEYSLLFN